MDARPKNFYNQGINFSLFSHTNSHNTHSLTHTLFLAHTMINFAFNFLQKNVVEKKLFSFVFFYVGKKATKSNAVKIAFSVFHSKWGFAFARRATKPFQFGNWIWEIEIVSDFEKHLSLNKIYLQLNIFIGDIKWSIKGNLNRN